MVDSQYFAKTLSFQGGYSLSLVKENFNCRTCRWGAPGVSVARSSPVTSSKMKGIEPANDRANEYIRQQLS